MIKTKLQIKPEITIVDKATVIQAVVYDLFDGDTYMPYFYDMSLTDAIARYLIEGYELEETDESLYDIVVADKDFMKLIKKFRYNSEWSDKTNAANAKYIEALNFIEENIHEVIEYEKVRHANNNGVLKDFSNMIERAMEVIRNIDPNIFSTENVQMLTNIFKELGEEGVTIDAVAKAIQKEAEKKE